MVTLLLGMVQIMASSCLYHGKFNDNGSSTTLLPFLHHFNKVASIFLTFSRHLATVSSESRVTFPFISRLLKAVIVYSHSAPVKLSPVREVHERLLKGFYLLLNYMVENIKQSVCTQSLFVTYYKQALCDHHNGYNKPEG